MEIRLCFRIYIRIGEHFVGIVAIEWIFMESKPQAAYNFIHIYFW